MWQRSTRPTHHHRNGFQRSSERPSRHLGWLGASAAKQCLEALGRHAPRAFSDKPCIHRTQRSSSHQAAPNNSSESAATSASRRCNLLCFDTSALSTSGPTRTGSCGYPPVPEANEGTRGKRNGKGPCMPLSLSLKVGPKCGISKDAPGISEHAQLGTTYHHSDNCNHCKHHCCWREEARRMQLRGPERPTDL